MCFTTPVLHARFHLILWKQGFRTHISWFPTAAKWNPKLSSNVGGELTPQCIDAELRALIMPAVLLRIVVVVVVVSVITVTTCMCFSTPSVFSAWLCVSVRVCVSTCTDYIQISILNIIPPAQIISKYRCEYITTCTNYIEVISMWIDYHLHKLYGNFIDMNIVYSGLQLDWRFFLYIVHLPISKTFLSNMHCKRSKIDIFPMIKYDLFMTISWMAVDEHFLCRSTNIFFVPWHENSPSFGSPYFS